MPWHKASLIPKPIAWQGKRSPVSRAQFLPTRYPCFRLGTGVRAGTAVTSSRKTRADTEIESVTANELVDKELKNEQHKKSVIYNGPSTLAGLMAKLKLLHKAPADFAKTALQKSLNRQNRSKSNTLYRLRNDTSRNPWSNTNTYNPIQNTIMSVFYLKLT